MQVTTNNLERFTIFPEPIVGDLELSVNCIAMRMMIGRVRRKRSENREKGTEEHKREEGEEKCHGHKFRSCAILLLLQSDSHLLNLSQHTLQYIFIFYPFQISQKELSHLLEQSLSYGI